MKKTVIIGSKSGGHGYSGMAAQMLKQAGHEFVPLGVRRGEVFGQKILDINELPEIQDVHTITLYVNPEKQKRWYDYLLSLKAERVIFNPGTENQEFKKIAEKRGGRMPECLHTCYAFYR